MALKKPSDFFGDNGKNSSDVTRQEINSADIGSVLKIREDFKNFEGEYKKFKNLDDFSLAFESFKQNVDKVDTLSEVLDSLKEEIDSLASKEDLDSAITAQLLYVEKNIEDLKHNVKSLNSKTLVNIKTDFKDLEESVNEFLDIDVPNHKKLVKDSEVRVDKKIQQFKEYIDDNFDVLEEEISSRFSNLSENLEGINEENLDKVYKEVTEISDQVNNLLKKEFPKFNKFFAETEISVSEKIEGVDAKIYELQESINSKITEVQDSYEKRVESLKETVNNFVDLEISKYKKTIIESKLDSESKVNDLEKILTENIDNFSNIIISLEKDNNLVIEEIKKDFLISKDKLDNISKTYENLYKDFKNREISENRKLESFSDEIDSLRDDIDNHKKINESETKKVSTQLDNKIQKLNENINDKISSIEKNILSNQKSIKENDATIEVVKISLKNLSNKLKEELLSETSKKIDKKLLHLEEVLEKFSEKTILNEGNSLLTDLPSTKTKDPLTPLDKNFVTFEDLSNHYRNFINRIQIQMASIGGGGAGFIKDLDDVDFDQTDGDGKLLIYDQSRSKWVGIASTAFGSGGGVVGAAGTWAVGSAGIHTTKNVGIGTTARENYSLYIQGDTFVSGNISVAGTVTYDDVTNVDSLGIITARQDVQIGRNLSVVGITTLGSNNGIGTVTVGVGETALYVDGNARIVGILTVGRASVTIDGDNNTITAGIVTITNSTIILGDNITLSGNASGINSAPNVIYVAKDGNDSNNGTSIDNAFLTISAAVGVATTGTIVKVLAGNYLENNPIEVPAFVSVVGDDLKTVTVSPNNASDDIFHVRKGCYIANMTFTNHISPSAAISFPTTEVAVNVGGGKWESPYVQNCTSNTTTGTGLRIDGAQAEGLKSIVCDSYTQYNQGGVGVAITNSGYAQLVSVFTICCDVGISCHKGSQCSLTNSNTSFGTYGLVSDGVGDLQFTGVVTSTANAAQDTVIVAINTSTRPYDGQVVYFDKLYYAVETITVTNGGSGYLTTPSVTISSSDGPNGQTATAFATLNGDSVESITIISSGNQYSSPPTITISTPDSGTTATATANMTPLYYTINSSTPVTAGITTLTIDENLNNTIGVGVTAYFYQVSRISASSHTFEYVGSGNDITTATPLRGGVPNQENEVIETSGGKIIYTSTDQSGNFRIGNELQINQNTGTISGRAFTRSLFTEMTPFILALS